MNYPQQGAIGATHPTNVVGRRILAFLIDSAILAAVTTAIVAAGSQSGELGSANEALDYCDVINDNVSNSDICVNSDQFVYVVTASSLGTAVLVGLAIWLVNNIVLPSITGFSIGKGITGLRIVGADDGEKAGFGPNLIRSLVWIVDAAPYCFPLVGLITVLTSDRHQRVGDRAGGTIVVARSSMGAQFAPPHPIGTLPTVPAAAPWTPPTSNPTDFGAPAAPPSGFGPPADTAPTDFGPPSGAPADLAPPSTSTDPFSAAPSIQSTPAPPSGPPNAPAAEPAHPGVDAPTWDSARNTYIQWDKDLEAWMEWDANGQAWIPIST